MGKLKGKAGVLGQAGWKTCGVKAAKEHVSREGSMCYGLCLPDLGENSSLFANLVMGLGLKA